MSDGKLAGSSQMKRVTVRIPEDLRDSLDETIEGGDRWDDRSKWVREMARRTIEDGPERDGLLPPNKEHLANAYDKLLDVAGSGGWVPIDDVETLLSDSETPAKAVERRLLRPLEDRGYIRIASDQYGQQKSIMVRGAE